MSASVAELLLRLRALLRVRSVKSSPSVHTSLCALHPLGEPSWAAGGGTSQPLVNPTRSKKRREVSLPVSILPGCPRGKADWCTGTRGGSWSLRDALLYGHYGTQGERGERLRIAFREET